MLSLLSFVGLLAKNMQGIIQVRATQSLTTLRPLVGLLTRIHKLQLRGSSVRLCACNCVKFQPPLSDHGASLL
jgi:hypothetical protein